MKLSQSLLVSLCLLGATHLAGSQVKESAAAHTIPGFLDPATRKFTTRITPAANASQNPQATTAPTSILFREDFQIKITNYDQPGTTAVCSVDMSSSGDSEYQYIGYEEQASVSVSSSGGSFSCDVPVLASWLLQTPTMDTIDATISVTIYTSNAQTGAYGNPIVYRSTSRSLIGLPQPGNTQTVVQTVNITL